MKTSKTIIAGLIGAGIQKSLTPALHMREGAEHGINYTYNLLDITELDKTADDLPELLSIAKNSGYSGLNITFPCKQAILPYLDELSADAQALSAVNTVVFKEGRAIGHNTDWFGYAENFKRFMPNTVALNAVLQIGAGGAGVAVAHALAVLGLKDLFIFDVDKSKAEMIVNQLSPIHPKTKFHAVNYTQTSLKTVDGVINCTPIGMSTLPGTPIDTQHISPTQWVSEIIYFPLETQFLQETRAKGCITLDGGGMAIFQAVRAFELITGLKPNEDRMTAHFKRLI